MCEDDTGEFIAMLRDVYGLYPQAKPLADAQIAMFFRALSGFSIDAVRAGLDAHVRDHQRGRFAPLPADVIAQIEACKAADGRPGSDEAWAIAVRSADEAATVVWTEEIAQAWGIAKSVMELGDEVGARVAFRDAYERIVADARNAGTKPNWFASLGHDAARREEALRQADSIGRLPYSPVLALAGPTRDPEVMRPLLESKGMPAHVREKLAQLRASLSGERKHDDEPGEDFLQKQRTAELQRETQRKVDEYLQRGGNAEAA